MDDAAGVGAVELNKPGTAPGRDHMDMDLPASSCMLAACKWHEHDKGHGRRPCCKDWPILGWAMALHSEAHKKDYSSKQACNVLKVGALPAMPISLTACA